MQIDLETGTVSKYCKNIFKTYYSLKLIVNLNKSPSSLYSIKNIKSFYLYATEALIIIVLSSGAPILVG